MRFRNLSFERQLVIFTVLMCLAVFIICCPDTIPLWLQ